MSFVGPIGSIKRHEVYKKGFQTFPLYLKTSCLLMDPLFDQNLMSIDGPLMIFCALMDRKGPSKDIEVPFSEKIA